MPQAGQGSPPLRGLGENKSLTLSIKPSFSAGSVRFSRSPDSRMGLHPMAVAPIVAEMSMAFKRVDETFMDFLFVFCKRLMQILGEGLEWGRNVCQKLAWVPNVEFAGLDYSNTVISRIFESGSPFIDALPLNWMRYVPAWRTG
jgi:hypothetical protein